MSKLELELGNWGTGETGAGAEAVAEAGHGLVAPVANRRSLNVRDNWPQSAGGAAAQCVASEAAKIQVSSVSNCLNLDGSKAATKATAKAATAAAALWLPAKKSSQTRNWGIKFNININIKSGS